jgi:DNA (cytosine-5)-methyltransferase 1
MNVLDLFSGIGGFSLGLERAGMRTVAFCELDPFCRSVLKKHWPNVPIFEDVTKLKASDINDQINVIAGGFPCQDISSAGRGAGLSGSRSGLWFEFHRLIKEIKPQVAIIENVSALRSRGLDQVLRSLAEIGYDAEWHCIPASAVGAPHRRDRIWILAYTEDKRADRGVREQTTDAGKSKQWRDISRRSICNVWTKVMADTISFGQQGQRAFRYASDPTSSGEGQAIDAFNGGFKDFWSIEPDVGRVANGVPNRVDRLRALGNAVVPQIPEIIGRAIMKAKQ